jgi:peptidyl-prolyl cis-trans isomerase D
MLDNLRANKGGIITYVFLFAIIIVFVVSFGPGSFDKGCTGAQGPVWAAKVNGEVIPATDYERGYQNLLRGFQQQAGQAFTRELAEQLGLASMAMNQLVERELVVQEARRQGIVVSDEELAKTIFALPSFQTDGRFDKELYQRTVSSVYGSPSRFETVLREDLLYQRMMAALRETVKVSDAEVKQAWTTEHDKVSLAFVRFPPAAAEAEVKKPTDAEVAAFAAKEGARIEKAYQEGAARFDQPKKVHARHILVRAAADAPVAESQAAREKLEAIATRIQKGEDFAKVAAETSQDEGTKEKGGDLGFVAEGLVEKPFADAAFALKQGAVSEPVRTSSGWHLVKADEVVEARKIPLEAARADLARELLVKDRAAALLEQRAAAALAAVKRGTALAELFPTAEAAKKARRSPVLLGGVVLAADSTGPFAESGPFIPKLGAVAGLAATALATPAGQPLPSVVSTPLGPVVAVVESREKPDPAKFDAEREAIAARLRNRRESQVQQAWLKKLRDAADVKVNAALTGPGPGPGRAG